MNPPAEAPTELRIDDLAREAGVASTTIRLYQHKGLLPGPRLEGRTGWYGARHLDRLRLIGRLQEEGHSLAGIARLLEHWQQGDGLHDLVGQEAGLAALLGGNRSVTLSLAELAERLPLDATAPATLAAAVEGGLVELADDGRVRVPDPRFLEIGPALVDLGLTNQTVVEEWTHLRGLTDAIADRFVSLFERELLPTEQIEDLSPAQVTALAQDLTQLHRLAGQVVQASLDASIAGLARERLARIADAAGATADPDA